MILLRNRDITITVALSTKDMLTQPSEMTLKNLQSKEVTTHTVYDISTVERTGIYQFYVVGTAPVPPLGDTTILKLQDGVYEYTIGEEIGLLQVGIPELNKTEYSTNETNIVYGG